MTSDPCNFLQDVVLQESGNTPVSVGAPALGQIDDRSFAAIARNGLFWPFCLVLNFSKVLAHLNSGQKKSSHGFVIVVESNIITTKRRGISCGNLLQSPFWSCHFQAVWIMIFSAAWSALALAQLWLGSRAAVMAQGRFWAACSAQFVTTSTSAANATKINPAFGRNLSIRPNGYSARLAFLHVNHGPWPAHGQV